MKKTIVLVYQAGIANVFEIDNEGNRKRLLQGTFGQCAYYALGMAQAGLTVRTMACNKAGDIASQTWTFSLANQPFSEQFTIVNRN